MELFLGLGWFITVKLLKSIIVYMKKNGTRLVPTIPLSFDFAIMLPIWNRR